MGKIITSPVEKWPGTVTIPDPLTLPQFAVWEECLYRKDQVPNTPTNWQLAFLPGILKLVEKWELVGFPEAPTLDTFPVKPNAARNQLIYWLINEFLALWNDEGSDPNG